MRVITLVDNISTSDVLGCEHGLSLYIETKKHKILFDSGSSMLFAENARKMSVDLAKIDIVVISHGHYDHGGGLGTFLNLNHHAKIYMHKTAFGDYYSRQTDGKMKYIGLDKAFQTNERFVFVDGHHVIDEELELFSNVSGVKLEPSGNRDLFVKRVESFEPDDFSHEQNLIIKENKNMVLLAGCAHHGIVNILDQFFIDKKCQPSHVIGGFHLYNRSSGQYENPNMISEIGSNLLRTGAVFYTCHCTGINAYEQLKLIMGKNVNYQSTGNQMSI